MYTRLCIFFVLTIFLSCKEQSTNETTDVSNQETQSPMSEEGQNSASIETQDNDPYLVETPKGYFELKDLRKMPITEMYNIGTSGSFKKDFPLYDKDGNQVDWSVMEQPEKRMFMQIYADENGNPAGAVVYELTDEVKALILKVRMAK